MFVRGLNKFLRSKMCVHVDVLFTNAKIIFARFRHMLLCACVPQRQALAAVVRGLADWLGFWGSRIKHVLEVEL